MRRPQLLITLFALALLLAVSLFTRLSASYGAVPWYGWAALLAVVLISGFAFVAAETGRARRQLLTGVVSQEVAPAARTAATAKLPLWVKTANIPYPHPEINVETCIGCHACVDACPQDVLAIVNGKAAPVRLDQCVEDTSCQVECPTVPKSCVVINTDKKIAARQVPKRDGRFMTNVHGVYMVGDVSGVPLIKNAINEGGAVIDYIVADLGNEGRQGAAEYDVAIIGAGPGGLSAAVLAKQRGLKYVALEQDQTAATIQQTYPNGKYVFFNPTDQPVKGGVKLDGAGATKEAMLGSWLRTMQANGVVINEFESCTKVRAQNGHFAIETWQEKSKQQKSYTARKVILAIGNRGTPARLKVPGEELKVMVTLTDPVYEKFCQQCRTKRIGDDKFCQVCGAKFGAVVPPPYEDEKVKYRLSDPGLYRGQHCLVVGAGNSAVEAAIDLAAVRDPAGARIIGWRDNVVTLVIRSDFKSDLKLINKMLVYECLDEGRIKVFTGMTVKEIFVDEVALMSARERDPKTAKETVRIKNNYVFALIGGEKPTKFLEALGVQIG